MSAKLPDHEAPLTTPLDFTDLVIRPARRSDLDDYGELALLAGPGFTSLPADEALLAERLALAETAFAGGPGALTLSLVDSLTGRVVGCAAVKPGGSPRPDFLNLQISPDGTTLAPTRRYAALTEVGSLFLHPGYRRAGIGRWLAQSRYLLIAAERARFGNRLFSELRGVVDPVGRSPFFDGLYAGLLPWSYAEADQLCAKGRGGELGRLLPTAPIAIATLGAAARAVIGRPHPDGRRALTFLDAEGFRFEGVVDLLDGGPLVVAERDQVRTIRTSFTAPLARGKVDGGEGRPACLLAGEAASFRSGLAHVLERDGVLIGEAETLDTLEVTSGALVRASFADGGEAAHVPRAIRPAACPCAFAPPPLTACAVCGSGGG